MIDEAREFAIVAHGDQKYGEKPYSHHLDAVAKLLEPFGEVAVVAGYLHDVVEDTDIELETIEMRFGVSVAKIINVVTDQTKGNRTMRKAHANQKLALVPENEQLALVVAAADRLANLQASLDDKDKALLKMYSKEYEQFKSSAYREGLCEDLWARLDKAMEQCSAIIG